jgi:hypothetical protein
MSYTSNIFNHEHQQRRRRSKEERHCDPAELEAAEAISIGYGTGLSFS